MHEFEDEIETKFRRRIRFILKALDDVEAQTEAIERAVQLRDCQIGRFTKDFCGKPKLEVIPGGSGHEVSV